MKSLPIPADHPKIFKNRKKKNAQDIKSKSCKNFLLFKLRCFQTLVRVAPLNLSRLLDLISFLRIRSPVENSFPCY